MYTFHKKLEVRKDSDAHHETEKKPKDNITTNNGRINEDESLHCLFWAAASLHVYIFINIFFFL